jgi:hypothetical protein
MSFCLDYGIVGFKKDIIHLKLYPQAEFCYLHNIAVSSPSQRLYGPEARTHFSNIPPFQLGRSPYLELVKDSFDRELHKKQ